MTATYAWIIDRDHLPTEGAAPGTYGNAVGVTGPSTAPADDLRIKADTPAERIVLDIHRKENPT